MIFDALRFLQINLHQCRNANDAFIKYAIEFNINIALIQDPYIFNDAIAGLASKWLFFLSNKLSSSMIFTNSDISLESWVSDNCVIVSLSTTKWCSFYRISFIFSADLDVELAE